MNNPPVSLVRKSVTQQIQPDRDLVRMMEIFRDMVNHCIKIGLKHDCCTLKRLSLLAYHELNQYDIMASYKLNAISQACGRLAQMKQSIRRGVKTKSPHIRKPYITNCYGFKINGCLFSIPYKSLHPFNILLNNHTVDKISELKVKSFVITPTLLSLSVQKEVKEIPPESAVGIDRNLRNVTCGNNEFVTFYKTNKLLSIKQNTIYARTGFKRNDQRKKKQFYKRLHQRLQKRTVQYIHKISKDIVTNAVKTKSVIAFENLKGIRKLYKKGNGQGKRYRRRMNGWQFHELQRQVEYKARWEGIPVVFVDPKCTSKLCPRCGKRIQEDRQNKRKLWCSSCMRLMDRDVVASLNISCKAWARFTHARGDTNEAQSGIFESVMTEPRETVIRIVDVSKSNYCSEKK